MELTKQPLHFAFLAFWLLNQADAAAAVAAQGVTVTIGEFATGVFIEWVGVFSALPGPFDFSNTLSSQAFVSDAFSMGVVANLDYSCYKGTNLSGFRALSTGDVAISPDTTTGTGDSMVAVTNYGASACIATNYNLGDLMTGCMIFNGLTFATMPGGAIINDQVVSMVSWAGGTNAIVFQTDKMATSSICFPPPPVAPPVAAPVAAPIAAPVAAPVATPVAAPVAPPVTAPVAAPVATPVLPPVAAPARAPIASPLSPPTTAGNTSCIAIIIGALLSIAGAIITAVFCIW